MFYSGWRDDGSWYQLYQIGFGGIPGRPSGDGLVSSHLCSKSAVVLLLS